MRSIQYLKKFVPVLTFVIIVLPFTQPAYADDNRMKERFGVYGTLFGEPLISLMGVDFAYNALDFLRLNAGAGAYPGIGVSLYTLGVGAKLMVPHWEFTPFLGGSFAQWFTSSPYGAIPYYDVTSGTILSDPHYFYLMVGFDYQAKDGFDIGLGVAYGSFIPPGYGGIPDIFFGKYF